MCVLIFSATFSETFTIVRINLYIMIKAIIPYVKYSCQILVELESFQQFFGKSSNISFMNIRPVGAELFQVNRRTDRQT